MPGEDTYTTISGPSEGLYKEKGSRFIALAYPVESEEMAKQLLDSIRKEYHSARHHCYAYRTGGTGDIYRTNDDGEPSGSAGKPIYGQILSADITNILVVVVRYFGGIKLGVSGLINAYRSAARDAIDNAVKVEKVITCRILLEYGYPVMNDIMRIIKELPADVINQDFSETCRLEIVVRTSHANQALQRFRDIQGVLAQPCA